MPPIQKNSVVPIQEDQAESWEGGGPRSGEVQLKDA